MLTFEKMKSQISRQDSAFELTLAEYRVMSRINTMFAHEHGRYMDANESMNLLRALTEFSNEIYAVKLHPDHRFNQVAPIRARADRGQRSILWHVSNAIGEMKFLSTGARDIPNLSEDLTERSIDIKIAGARVTWTWEQLEAAIFMGKSLPFDAAVLGRQAADRLHERVTLEGDAQFKIPGMLSSPNDLTHYTDINWAGLADTDAQVAALQGLVDYVDTASNESYAAGMLVLPPGYRRSIEKARYGDSPFYSTVLDFLEYTYRRRNFKVLDWAKLKGVTIPGVIADKDVAMAYPFSFEVLENGIVNPFFMKPPKENENYDVSAGVYTKTAGTFWRQPKAGVWTRLN
jgi:hypothetical protein